MTTTKQMTLEHAWRLGFIESAKWNGVCTQDADSLAAITAMKMDLGNAHLAKGAQEWQPIETAPRDGTEIFLWQSDHTVPVVAHWYWFGDRELMQGCWVANKSFYSAEHSVVEDDTDTKYVTHWMPLPAAPMLSQRGGGWSDECQ